MTKVEYYHSGSWVDISDYITASDPVPFITRNRDYSLRSESMNLSIAITLQDESGFDSVFDFTVDDKFRIYDGSKLIFAGYVEHSRYDYKSDTWEITIADNLLKLDKVLIDYNTLHALFAAGTNWYEYTASDYQSHGIVGILWMMKCMFQAAGLTLDVSEIEDTVLFTSYINSQYVDITYKDYFTYDAAIWNIGQNVAVHYSILDSTDYNYNANKPSCWEVIQDLFSYFSLVIIRTDVDSFKAVAKTTNYSIANADYFKRTMEKVKVDGLIDNISITGSSAIIADYENTDPNNIASITSATVGKGKDNISIISNLIIAVSNAKMLTNKYQDAYIIPITPFEVSSDLINYDNTADAYMNIYYNKIIAKISDYTKETLETNAETTEKSVVENKIDLEWETSEIIQETF